MIVNSRLQDGQAVGHVGEVLRAARLAAGISLATMAKRTNYTKAYLSLLETGRRTVAPNHATAYARALGMSISDLAAAPDDPVRIAHEWLVSDQPLQVQTRAGRRIGETITARLESRTIALRHLDDTMTGPALLPLVRKELAEAVTLVREGSYREHIGVRLLTVAAELGQLAGWIASDIGNHGQAQHCYLTGMSAAREAGNRPLAAQLLSSLSYQLANIGNPRDAALLARSAAAGATGATPVVRALLLERVAWASARSVDREAARRALDAVNDAYQERSAGIAEPEWVYWLDQREIDVMAGRCLIELGSPGAAEPLLAGAIAGYHTDHARETALYLTWLAEAYVRAGQFDAAKATMTTAANAATGTQSARVDQRLRRIAGLLSVS